jgi:hypothetical protein
VILYIRKKKLTDNRPWSEDGTTGEAEASNAGVQLAEE